MNVNVFRVFEPDKFKDQLIGLGFGILCAVGLAAGVQLWAKIDSAPDAALLTGSFWIIVGKGLIVTAIRSTASAVGTALGLSIPGISSGS